MELTTEANKFEENEMEWLEAVKRGDSKAVEQIYRAYRKWFVDWLRQKTGCNQETALDIFQDSVLAFYKNTKSGKLDTLTSSIKTYIFAIGYKMYLYRNRQRKIKSESLDSNKALLSQLSIPEEPNVLNDQQKMISALMKHLRPICRNILKSFYYEGLSLKLIAQKHNYKSSNVAKVMKARCMESLRKTVRAQMRKN